MSDTHTNSNSPQEPPMSNNPQDRPRVVIPMTPALSSYVQSLEKEKARLKAENEALVSEFRETVTEDWSADDVKKKIRDLMAVAYERMATLMVHADNEAVQAKLIMYVFNIGIGQIKVTDDNDANAEFKELLLDIKRKPDEASTTTSGISTDEST